MPSYEAFPNEPLTTTPFYLTGTVTQFQLGILVIAPGTAANMTANTQGF
jgi:hypothetical protein